MTGPMNSGDSTPSVCLGDWLARLRAELGDDATRELTARESAALFALARVVAHTSERIAAPLTTFLAGLVLGELGCRGAGRIRDIRRAWRRERRDGRVSGGGDPVRRRSG